jgi:Holliday junction resolvase RusA-like endonuclease
VFNFEKLLSDFMAKKMPYTDRERVPWFEDHKILQGTVRKIQSNRNEVEVIIREIKEDFTY